MRKKEDDHTVGWIKTARIILTGGIFSLLICILILFVCSVGISRGILSNRTMMQYTVAGCLFGALFGGLYSVRQGKTKTLFVGLGTACIEYLMILTIGFLFYPEISVASNGLAIAAGCGAGGAIAGFLGGKPKKKRRK